MELGKKHSVDSFAATHDASPLMVWCSTNPSEHSEHVEDDSYRQSVLVVHTDVVDDVEVFSTPLTGTIV